jgi:hypothetical protein
MSHILIFTSEFDNTNLLPLSGFEAVTMRQYQGLFATTIPLTLVTQIKAHEEYCDTGS